MTKQPVQMDPAMCKLCFKQGSAAHKVGDANDVITGCKVDEG